jgi:tol-pal system protein YbgF
MKRATLPLLIGLLLTGGCASQRGLHFPFGGKSEAQVDSTALRMAEIEQRFERVDATLTRIEGLVRQNNADVKTQLGELAGDVRTVEERVAGLDRRAPGEWRGAGPAGAAPDAGYPGTDGRAVVLDQTPSRFGIPARGDTLAPVPIWDRGGASAPRADAAGRAAYDSSRAVAPSPLEEPRSTGAEGGRPDPPADGQRLYQVAYQDLMEENYQLALINFRAFLEHYPQTRLSDNAQYWIGEVYYGQRQFQTAIEEFRRVVEDYATGDKVPAAYYKLALCFQNQRDLPTARRYLEFLIAQYPNAREARLAEATLTELK